MADQGKKVEVRFGAFTCSIEGYDNPVEQMREVLGMMQRMIAETPALAEADPHFDADRIESALGDQADGNSPGVVVIRNAGETTTAEIPVPPKDTGTVSPAVAATPSPMTPDVGEPIEATVLGRTEKPDVVEESDETANTAADLPQEPVADTPPEPQDTPSEQPAAAFADPLTPPEPAPLKADYIGFGTGPSVRTPTMAEPAPEEATTGEQTTHPQTANAALTETPVETPADEIPVSDVSEALDETSDSAAAFADIDDQGDPEIAEIDDIAEFALEAADDAAETTDELAAATADLAAATDDLVAATDDLAAATDDLAEETDIPEPQDDAPEVDAAAFTAPGLPPQAAPADRPARASILNIFSAPKTAPSPSTFNIFAPAASAASDAGATQPQLREPIFEPEAEAAVTEAVRETIVPAPSDDVAAEIAEALAEDGPPEAPILLHPQADSVPQPVVPPVPAPEIEKTPDSVTTRLRSIFAPPEPVVVDRDAVADGGADPEPEPSASLETAQDSPPIAESAPETWQDATHLAEPMPVPEPDFTPEPEPFSDPAPTEDAPKGRFASLLSRIHSPPMVGAPADDAAPEPTEPELPDAVSDGAITPADLAAWARDDSVPGLLAASAAWLTLSQGNARFTRREVMSVLEQIPSTQPRGLAERIKGFGKLVRSGSLILVDDGVFAMAQSERDRFQGLIDQG